VGKANGKSWWKVPVFCVAAGLLWFQAEVHFLYRFAIIVPLPDGSLTVDNALSMLLSAIEFAVTLAVGGLLIFRKMTRKELILSASVMFAFGLVCGLVTQFAQPSFISTLYLEMYTWCIIISRVLLRVDMNQWIAAVILWAAPFLFVLFGKKDVPAGVQS